MFVSVCAWVYVCMYVCMYYSLEGFLLNEVAHVKLIKNMQHFNIHGSVK